MQSRLLFLLAILMGIITTAIFFYTNQTDEVEPKEKVQMQQVVVLANDVTENQRLTEDDVQLKEIPQAQVHPSALKKIEAVQGKLAAAEMKQGEVVLSHRLKSSEKEQQFISLKVNEGYRAVSISVDIVQSVSNLIQPEDYVDVIFTYGNGEGETPAPSHPKLNGISENLLDQQESVILLEKVRVLAVGKKMVSQSEGGATPEYSQITLELTPEDTVTMVNASKVGSIHLALHTRVVDEKQEEESS